MFSVQLLTNNRLRSQRRFTTREDGYLPLQGERGGLTSPHRHNPQHPVPSGCRCRRPGLGHFKPLRRISRAPLRPRRAPPAAAAHPVSATLPPAPSGPSGQWEPGRGCPSWPPPCRGLERSPPVPCAAPRSLAAAAAMGTVHARVSAAPRGGEGSGVEGSAPERSGGARRRPRPALASGLARRSSRREPGVPGAAASAPLTGVGTGTGPPCPALPWPAAPAPL